MPDKRSLWTGIGIQLVSFIVWAVVAIFFLGGSRQKMVTVGNDMAEWKEEWKAEKAHITKMDLEGSVATKNFVHQYEREQGKQYERLKHLEDEVNHLDQLQLRIERLEREQGIGKPKTEIERHYDDTTINGIYLRQRQRPDRNPDQFSYDTGRPSNHLGSAMGD